MDLKYARFRANKYNYMTDEERKKVEAEAAKKIETNQANLDFIFMALGH